MSLSADKFLTPVLNPSGNDASLGSLGSEGSRVKEARMRQHHHAGMCHI